MNKKTYMTLKEAAEKSGYSADYIGQLIRNGKLSGKQMYSGVAWVTTEDALNEYLKNSRGEKKSKFEKLLNYVKSEKEENLTERFSRIMMYVAIGLGLIIVIALFYILSLKLDRAFEQRGVQQIEATHS